MSEQSTVMINGVEYDAHTGMRIANDAPEQATNQANTPAKHTKKPAVAAHAVHKTTHRTNTLNRAHVAEPTHHKAAKQKQPKPVIQRSPMVRKFADISPAKATATPVKKQAATTAKESPDIAPVQHPIQPVVAHQPAEPASVKPAREVKEQAIQKALESAKPAKKPKKKSFLQRHPRALSISTASLALLLLAGYLTYINLPSISVRVAAAQAGLAATYPSYQPSGYSLSGPVAYADGQVSMKFAANVSSEDFTVNQTKSTWDSSALLDNYVTSESNGDYATFSDGGLTIYVYDTNAAWVSGGILHTIKGNAPLTSDQIRKIATSM